MAIALDTSDTNRRLVNPGTSLTYSYTCTGSNLLLLTSMLESSATTQISSMTYNLVACTVVNSISTDSGANTQSSWYLLSPSTGANNVVVSLNSSITMQGHSTSYTGVSQSGFPDAQTTASVSGVTTQTMTLTTIATNCWMYAYQRNGSDLGTAGSGTTMRNPASTSASAIDDSNGALAAGSNSLVHNWTNPAGGWANIISFAPAGASSLKLLSLMGVGT